MANKLRSAVEILQATVSELTVSEANWRSFLGTASMNYKYSFANQVLIYAQRPDATACASIEFWNKRYKRWVKKNSKGIAILDDSGVDLKLRYVFDVADTHRYHDETFKLWQVWEEHQESVIESLANNFGEISHLDFKQNIGQIAENLAVANEADYLAEILEAKENSSLATLDEITIQEALHQILKNSVEFMLLNRAGAADETYKNSVNFPYLTYFNTLDTVTILGTAVSEIAQIGLRDMERTVKDLERQAKEMQFFAKSVQMGDNELEENKNIERSDSHASNLQTNGGLPFAGISVDTGAENRQIRHNAQGISEKYQTRAVQQAADSRRADEALMPSRTASNGGNSEIGGNFRPGGGFDGGNEERKFLGVGAEEEPNPQTGGGNRAPRNSDELILNGDENSEKPASSPFLRVDEEFTNEDLADVDELPVLKSETEQLKLFGENAENISQLEMDIEKESLTKNALFDGEDRYFHRPSAGEYEAVYYNSDADAGGQFVVLHLSYELLNEAKANTDNVAAFYNYLDERAETELVDAQTAEFTAFLNEYTAREPDLLGRNEAVMHALTAQAAAKELIPIGAELMLDERKFVIESVEKKWGEVFLRDVTFAENVGYPIFRSEKIAFIREQLNAQEKAQISLKETSETEVLKRNYRFTNADEIQNFSPKEKYRRNIQAIKLLKALEREKRLADESEQEILAQYVGWGGLSEAFDETKSAWRNEYIELKNLLSAEEYKAARESTLTAFYTPQTIITAIYQGLANLGFQGGNILEPSCGVGNFFGALPESMSASRLYGVELDKISGHIAQMLYQKANIQIQGFERTDFSDNFFDAAIGNVPFGQFKVQDKRYDKENFLIHDYFFAKSLDKVRPNGVIAFVTSKGTLDKENPKVRKYLAQRAELLGAIRLPNNTFAKNAGTEVTADIVFLQKRERFIAEPEAEWLKIGEKDGIRLNQYFINHPEMILGEMREISGAFGKETACIAREGENLEELLNQVVANIRGDMTPLAEPAVEFYDEEETEIDASIPAEESLRNFSYGVFEGKLYYRNNSRMYPVKLNPVAENRIRRLIEIRDCVRRLINYQLNDGSDAEILSEQVKLNKLYDDFAREYGIINSRANAAAFRDDDSYYLLCSLEILDNEGNFKAKADMFTKRTIKAQKAKDKAETSTEALALSIAEKAKADMPFMCKLTGKTEEQIYTDLANVIFLNPLYEENNPHNIAEKYLPADEYLSGNVREKLRIAQIRNETDNRFFVNVQALTEVQPQDLKAGEISVRLGANWLKESYIEDFIYELLDTPYYMRGYIKVHYSAFTGAWRIDGKSRDGGNIKAVNTYGTKRINAYEIIEDTLNLKDVRVMDYSVDIDGKRTATLNKKETAIAQSKQELIKEKFSEWIFSEQSRREDICRTYNELFNSNRPREYDGRHITFQGMNPEISLRPHQRNAVARILYGGNTLLAHTVGAGKTYTMTAAAMESKRLGLCNKSIFVVPNHLTEQWAGEFLQLYPAAKILVTTKKDFETKNRKKFCARIATGDYDAVIIGQSQFEKIPVSVERQQKILEKQIEDIIQGITEAKNSRAEHFTVKQMEKTKKNLELKLAKLNDQSRKDDVITFEELGVDRMFVDESHYYKNLYLQTKMRNVAGVAQTEAQKSSDMFMKCQYLDEITGGKGTVFATGTPISNSMTEMYTIQRYLQYHTLEKQGLIHFDAWAANFGETVTAIELSPEGCGSPVATAEHAGAQQHRPSRQTRPGYRAKTRFAKFFNLPELIMTFKEVADIQTKEMLNLPVPQVKRETVILAPSETQTEMVGSLAERAEKVRNKQVDISTDNMLLITNDGRKLALDQRLLNPLLGDYAESKSSKCAVKVYEIWERTKDKCSTQMIFCDLSTPKADGGFNVYDDLREKLISLGVPNEEIAYIHNAKSEMQKKELFAKVREGEVRILIGSTQKMGAGTNAQQKLIALHHLDAPWRPSDLEQREGRIIRQGNENAEVEIYTYVTEKTFDSYLYQLLENKQKFISQIMTGKSPLRSAEDVDEAALSYGEIKALATGNPLIIEKMDLDVAVNKLSLLKSDYLNQKYLLEDKISRYYPEKIAEYTERVEKMAIDIQTFKQTDRGKDNFAPMTLQGQTYYEKKEAGETLIELCKEAKMADNLQIGSWRGFALNLSFDRFEKAYIMTLQGEIKHYVTLGTDIYGNLQRMHNTLEKMPEVRDTLQMKLTETKKQLANAQKEVQKPFMYEEELRTKKERLDTLNALLSMDEKTIAVKGEKTPSREVMER